MENLLDGYEDQEKGSRGASATLVSSSVLDCASDHVARAFTQCDVDLLPQAAHVALCILPEMQNFHGAPSLLPKARIVYDVDNPDCRSFAMFSHTIPQLATVRSSTVRFFSVYEEMPQPADFEHLQIECFTQKKLDGGTSVAPIVARVDRVISHPVSQGCMKQSGVAVASTKENGREAVPWNLHWGARLDDEELRDVQAHQRINHFPGTWALGRKDTLARTLQKYTQQTSCPPFFPVTYLLPCDLPLLSRAMADNPDQVFIVKPPASARGKGIFLFCAKDGIPASLQSAVEPRPTNSEEEIERIVVQKYIAHPFLINGFKVDLRVYVLCTGYDPLRIYIYNDGLVRFATQPYRVTTDNLDDVCCHLTNYSINCHNEKYKKTSDASEDGCGSKWTLHALQKYFVDNGMDWAASWQRVQDVIIKTFLAYESNINFKLSNFSKHRFCGFELYGFDIMFDSNLVPQIIEVNVLPSLACGSALDKHIKGHLVADVLTIAGIPIDPETTNNIPLRPIPRAHVELLEQSDFFAKNASEEDRLVIRECECELSRKGGFQRVFPTSESERTYHDIVLSHRYFNKLLAKWECLKPQFTSAQREQAVLWLAGQAPFPQAPAAPPIMKKKSVPSIPRDSDKEGVPRRQFSHVSARVSAEPRVRRAKITSAPLASHRASIPITTFEFASA